MAAKKTPPSLSATRRALSDSTRAPKGPQLDSDAVFGDSAGGIWVHSNDLGNGYTYRMPNTLEVLQVECGDVLAGWSSSSGATYLATTAKHPLLRFFEGNFAHLPLETPTDSAVLVGRPGATPDQDRLLLLTRASDDEDEDEDEERAAELWLGTPTHMKRTALEIVGSPVGAAFGAGDEVWVGLGSHAGGAPSLLRVSPQGIERIALPKAAGASANVNGLACTPAGHLLVMIGHRTKEDAPAQPWLRRSDGRWTSVSAPKPLVGWLSGFGLLNHGSKIYVPTLKGVFSYEAEARALVRESQFEATSLWRCGDALVARGYRRDEHAHEILIDGQWLPLSVPEPDGVSGARGKQVYVGSKTALPVRRVRLAAPVVSGRATATKVKVTAPRKFAFEAFLENLATHAEAKKRKKPLDLAARVEADRGLPISKELRAYLTLLGSHALDFFVGQWLSADPNDELFLDTSSLDRFVIALQDSANVCALVTDLLPIGADISGNRYCVELAKTRSRVFVLDHELDEFTLVSDSLSTFSELNELGKSSQTQRASTTTTTTPSIPCSRHCRCAPRLSPGASMPSSTLQTRLGCWRARSSSYEGRSPSCQLRGRASSWGRA